MPIKNIIFSWVLALGVMKRHTLNLSRVPHTDYIRLLYIISPRKNQPSYRWCKKGEAVLCHAHVDHTLDPFIHLKEKSPDHSDHERETLLPPLHGYSSNSNNDFFFIFNIPYTEQHIPRYLLHQM